MGHIKGMRTWALPLDTGAIVHVYSDDTRVILQLRRQVATEADVLAPSFKVAVALAPLDALALASELLNAGTRALRSGEPIETNGEPDGA